MLVQVELELAGGVVQAVLLDRLPPLGRQAEAHELLALWRIKEVLFSRDSWDWGADDGWYRGMACT